MAPSFQSSIPETVRREAVNAAAQCFLPPLHPPQPPHQNFLDAMLGIERKPHVFDARECAEGRVDAVFSQHQLWPWAEAEYHDILTAAAHKGAAAALAGKHRRF